MFKLLKIRNSGFCTPDIVEVSAQPGMNYYPGHIYYLENERAVYPKNAENSIKFYSIDHITSAKHTDKVKGFYVTPDMLFETYFYGGDGVPMMGEMAMLEDDNKKGAYAVRMEVDATSGALIENPVIHVEGEKVLVSFR